MSQKVYALKILQSFNDTGDLIMVENSAFLDEFIDKLADKLADRLLEPLANQIVIQLRATSTVARREFKDLSSLLTEKQKKVFTEIIEVRGSSRSDIRRIEKLFGDLQGDRATEALVNGAKVALRERCLGVVCTCGEPAQVMWQKNKNCAEGGIFALSHCTDGRRKVHGSTTVFPKLKIINKPRRARK